MSGVVYSVGAYCSLLSVINLTILAEYSKFLY